MLLRLLLLLVLLPVLELMVLIRIGQRIGVLETIGLVVAAGLVGAHLVRRAGVRAIAQVQADLAAGRVPADSLLDGLIVLIASILLVFPGVISDGLALLLLIPPVRSLVRRLLKSQFKSRMVVMHREPPQERAGWVDVEARSAHDVDPPPRGQLE